MQILLLLVALIPAARADFHNQSELALVIAQGNTRSQSISAKQESKYSWQKNALGLKGLFLQAKSSGVLSSKRWNASLRYDRELGDRWSAFLMQGLESDRFAGYMRRYDSDLGSRYLLVEEKDQWLWAGELGYRYSVEHRTTGGKKIKNQLRLYSQLIRHWSSAVHSEFWVEFLPNFTHSNDWMLNSELSLSALITSVFSLKTAYQVKYDNEPAPGANTRADTLLTTALVAKF